MTRIAPGRIVAAARADLGKPAPTNTCWSKGGNKWPQDVGLPGIDTDSTTEARKRAKAGYHGWSYHEGMDGVREGDLLDWAAPLFHTSIVEDIDEHGNIRSIGAGGPTGEVWWQPRSQGYNPRSVFQGYFRPPTEDGKDPHTQPVKVPAKPKPKPAAAKPTRARPKTYTVVKGDNLWAIAKRFKTSTTAIARRNRARIKDPRHIEPGWVLTLP